MIRKTTGLIVAVVVMLPAAPAAIAQDANVLEEITVTAQRREQNLQEVPIAITAFTGAQIERLNVTGARDYLALTPNVSFTDDGQAGSRGLGLAIRGINNLVSGENAFINSIGIYIDEFSVASVPNQVANPFLPDMERVEILRGPQGTYFGRNSVGGALNLTTRGPSDQFEGSIRVGAETYDDAGESFNITGVLSGAVTDSFRLRGVVYYEDSSGLVDNACGTGASLSGCPAAVENGFTPNGTRDSGHDYFMGRLKGDWDITDALSLGFTLIYADESQGTDENVPSGILDIDSADSFGLFTALDPGTGFWPNNQNLLSHDQQESNDLETAIAIANLRYEFAGGTSLTWISGVIDAEQNRAFDNDLIGGADTLLRTNTYNGFSWSSELRLAGGNDTGDWIIGVMYAEDEQTQENNVAIATQPTATLGGVGWLPPFPEGLGLALNSKVFDVQSIAVFADYTWHASDNWDLTLGGRYTDDTVKNGLEAFGIGTIPPGGPPPNFVNIPRPASNASDTFSDFTPRFAMTYAINDNTNLYGVVSKGYKAGGNSVGNNTNQPGSPAFSLAFAKETLTNVEIGFKGQTSNQRFRVNGAFFVLQWDDFQMEAFRFLTPGDLSSNFEQTVNIEEAEAWGTEIEFVALFGEGFTFGGAIGTLHSEITSDTTVEITGGATVDLKGLVMPKAPELTWNLYGEYNWPIANNNLWLRAEVVSRRGQYSDIEGLTNQQTLSFREVGPNEFPYLSPDYTVANLRGGFDWESVSLIVYGQNIGNEQYYTGTQENFGVSGIRLRPNPRTWGASLAWNF